MTGFRRKKKYELLLRIAQRTSFDLTEESSGDMGMELLTDDTAEETADGWKTDCYIIGKYSPDITGKSGV